MKVLVYPNAMRIGGSQLGAIAMARAIADLGHDTAVYGVRGPLNSTVDELGLHFIDAPKVKRRPSPIIARALTTLVRTEGFDIVHGYEWPPAMEAAYGPHLRLGTPVVMTIMSMGVAGFLPAHLPLVVGTQLIGDDCIARGRSNVHVIEPWMDTKAILPVARPDDWARSWRIADGQSVVVVVSRLANELKSEGLFEAIDAVAALDPAHDARLLIVGDGPARANLEAHAAEVNAAAGREVATLTGEVFDPSPAYAVADVILGMGSSILRGMAFQKPAIVQGEGGFWKILTPDTLPLFLKQGWYGIGPESGGAARLTGLLDGLLRDPDRRAELARYSREVVHERFSVGRAADLHLAIYQQALERSDRSRVMSVARATMGLADYKVRRRIDRLRGRAAVDDFNARAAQPSQSSA